MLNYENLKRTPINATPFPYVILPNFIDSRYLPEIHNDYPHIEQSGSFPIQDLKYGEAFKRLIAALNSPTFRECIEEKFEVTLQGLPTITTVRGRCAARDGSIHTDSVTKIITILVYMNPQWEKPGGQLRLLRNATDIEDYIVEIPPAEGTLLAFKVTDNSWHGHLPFEGPRRVIQFNWLTSHTVAKRELLRHRLSYRMKRLRGWVKSKIGGK